MQAGQTQRVEYFVTLPPQPGEQIWEKYLNAKAAEGWRLHMAAGHFLIFERPVSP